METYCTSIMDVLEDTYMAIEQTLFILKPTATMRRFTGAKVFAELLSHDFKFKGLKEFTLSHALAEAHYVVHKGKRFYPWLIKFIKGGPVVAVIIEGESAISKIRELLGATLVQNADSESLRGKYGIWGGINIAHASDSKTTAEQEINLWTKQGGLDSSLLSRNKLESYVTRWDSPIGGYTTDIRKVCKRVLTENDPENLKKAEILLGAYLEKECIGFSETAIQNLAHLIIEHLLLAQ